MSSQISLSNYNKDILEYMYGLLEENCMSDVTLVCSGEEFVRGHQVVLSYRSPLFKKFFSELLQPNVFFILPEVPKDIMASIVKLMYLGYVDVPKNVVPVLLEMAEYLQIQPVVNDKVSSSNDQIEVEDNMDKLVSITLSHNQPAGDRLQESNGAPEKAKSLTNISEGTDNDHREVLNSPQDLTINSEYHDAFACSDENLTISTPQTECWNKRQTKKSEHNSTRESDVQLIEPTPRYVLIDDSNDSQLNKDNYTSDESEIFYQ